jgi:hypothetical protein
VSLSGCRGSTRARPSPRSSRACTRAPLPERCSVSTHQLDHMTWQDCQQRGLSMAGTAQCAVLTQLYNTGRAAELLAAMQCATWWCGCIGHALLGLLLVCASHISLALPWPER